MAMAVEMWPDLAQIDAPEMRGAPECDEELGLKAQQFTKNCLADSQVWSRSVAFNIVYDDFGRVLAEALPMLTALMRSCCTVGRRRCSHKFPAE
jgi:hypothetical protein